MQKSYERGKRLAQESVTSSLEYTLSDYQGDVKRVLYTSVTVGEGAKFVNGDAVECSGVVDYSIVYIDTEGRLTPVSFSGDYELSLRCDGECCNDVNTHTRVANYSIRLMGPRRFAVKALIECDAISLESREYKIEGDGDDLPLETRSETVRIERVGFGKGCEVELAEELVMLDGRIEDEVEVLLHRVEPRGIVYQRGEGGGAVKCSLAVRALIAIKGEEPRNYESTIDMVSRLESGEFADGEDVLPSVSVLSSVISLNPSEAGVSVVASVIATGSVESYHNTELEILDDCFSTDRDIEVTMGEFAYTEHVFSKPICEKMLDVEARIEDGRKIRNILYESARVKVGEIRPEGDVVALDGEMQISAISCEIDDNGDICYAPLKFDLPVHINVNVSSHISANMRYNCHLSAESLRVDVNGSSLIVSANIVGYISATSEKSCRTVSLIEASEERLMRDPSLISVYYPIKNESLFDIAKRFHVSVTRLAQINELSESVLASSETPGALSGVSYLMIK